jgi:hypothetical protein
MKSDDKYTNPINLPNNLEDKLDDTLKKDLYNKPDELKLRSDNSLPLNYESSVDLPNDNLYIPIGEKGIDKLDEYLSDYSNKIPNNRSENDIDEEIYSTPVKLNIEINEVGTEYISSLPESKSDNSESEVLSKTSYSNPLEITVEDRSTDIIEEDRYKSPISNLVEDNSSNILTNESRYISPVKNEVEDKSPAYLLLEKYINPITIEKSKSLSDLNDKLSKVVEDDSYYYEITDSLGYTQSGKHSSINRLLPPDIDPSNRRPRKDEHVGRSDSDLVTDDYVRRGLVNDSNNSESKSSDYLSNKESIPIDRKIEDYRNISEDRYSGYKIDVSQDKNSSSVNESKYSESEKIPGYSENLPDITENVVSLPVDTVPLTEDIKDKYANTAKWMSVQNDLDRGFNTVRKYEQLLGNYAQLGDWGQMVSSAVTGVLGAKNFRDNTRVPAHKVKALSELSAIRSTVQNNFTGPMGMAKQELIDELLLTTEIALRKARELAKENAGRLPGNNEGIISNFINEKLGGNLIKKGIDTVTGAIDSISNKIFGVDGGERVAYIDPKNRPEKIENYGYSKVTENLGSDISRIFSNDYISNGFYTTLSELANSSISNINELSEVLRNAPYITSWNKIMELDSDSNDKWEIVFKPFIGSENGNYTVLPDISEINTRNMKEFKVKTNYTNWLPFTGFELQHKKLTNKSVGLFDGEFSIPVSLEFTNEIRLTISDDQCKSFRWYFDTCTEASMYKRVKESDEMEKGEDYTKVYKDKPMTAMYKNVTFECSIYVLKGDLATVKKFPLLVTLRDYQVEYVGDQESSPVELNLHFSIVGELNTKMSDSARKLNSMELPNKPETPSLSTPGLNSASGSSKSSASLSGWDNGAYLT